MPTQQDKFKQAQAQLDALKNQAMALKEQQTQQVKPQVVQPQAPMGSIDVSNINTVTPKIDVPQFPIRPKVFTPTQFEEAKTQQSDFMSKITALEDRLSGQGDFMQDEYKALDIKNQRQELTKSRNRIGQLTTELEGIDDAFNKAYEGSVASTAFVDAEKQRAKSKIYSNIRAEEGLFSALNNDLSTSLTLLQEATNLEFEPIQQELTLRREQLKSIEGMLSKDEEALYKDAVDKLNKEEQDLANSKKNKTEIQKIALAVAENGGSASTVRQILTMNDLDQAITMAAPSLQAKKTGGSSVGGNQAGDYTTIITQLKAQGYSDADIRAYLDSNTDLTEGTITQLLGGKGSSSKFLDKNFVVNTLGGLDAVKKAAKKSLGNWISEPTNAQVNTYVEGLMKTFKQYVDLGYSDEEIYKQMQKK